MNLHYLDPAREPRHCSCSCHITGSVGTRCRGICRPCRGTGRLGVESAEPDVQVFKARDFDLWYWVVEQQGPEMRGPEPTEAAALAAARKAHQNTRTIAD